MRHAPVGQRTVAYRSGAHMRLPAPGQASRRLRPVLALLALAVAALAVLFVPWLALGALALAAMLIIRDQLALQRDLRSLAAAISSDDADHKLEVSEGPWGELSYALNRLRQQQRAASRLRELLPALPARAALGEWQLPSDGLPCDVAVLALTTPPGGMPVAGLRAAASVAAAAARTYDALISRSGEHLVVIFGATGQQSPLSTLRDAQQAARAIYRHWSASPAGSRPHLALASGQAHAVVLPGLGLSIVGQPIDQALALLAFASETQLLCNEDAYLGLRRLGIAPTQPRAAEPAPDGERAGMYRIPL